jgi:hypothetical protein
MGKTSDEVLRQSFHWIFVVKFGGAIDRAVNHYAALSIVAASKSSQLNLSQTTSLNKLPSSIIDSKHRLDNWIYSQIYKILDGKSKDTNVRFFIS